MDPVNIFTKKSYFENFQLFTSIISKLTLVLKWHFKRLKIQKNFLLLHHYGGQRQFTPTFLLTSTFKSGLVIVTDKE